MAAPQSILIIKLSSVGDIVLSTPVVRHLRSTTRARIVWVVDEGMAALLENHPDVDELLLFPRNPFRARKTSVLVFFSRVARFLELVRRLRAEAFDLAIDLQGRGRSYLLLKLCRAGRKIGRGRFPFLGERVLHRRNVARHAVESYFEATDLLPIPRPSRAELVISKAPSDQLRVARELQQRGIHRPFVCLVPWTTWDSKLWPIEYWSELAAWFIAQNEQVVLVGSGVESERAEGILQLMGRPPQAFSLFGALSLRELIHLFDRSALVIGLDNGPMHVAAASTVPMVGLFGPTDPVRTGPWPTGRAQIVRAPGCSTCRLPWCRRGCMRQLLPATVIATVKALRAPLQKSEVPRVRCAD